MSMSFQEIAAVALDEWEQGGVVAEAPTEGKFGIKMPDAGPKKMGASETAQAQALAGKSQAEQTQSLAEHDAVYHKKRPYDPNTSTCKLRQKLVETQKAIGAPISEQQAKQMGISKKDLDAGNHEANQKIDASKNGEEGADPAIAEIREMRKRNQSLTGEERTKADAELQAKCVEFAKKNLAQGEGEAVEGLFNKMKVMGKDIAQKIKDAFAKRDDSQMTEAQKAVKEEVVAEADEIITKTNGEVESRMTLTFKDSLPDGKPDGVHKQALIDTIGERDFKVNDDELSESEKDKRRTQIANRAAHYLDDWRDLDDPEKREAAVEKAIQDIEQFEASGVEHWGNENDVFEVSENESEPEGGSDKSGVEQSLTSETNLEELQNEVADLEGKLQGVEEGSAQQEAIQNRIDELKAQLPPPKKLNRQEKEEALSNAKEEYENLLRNGADEETLNAALKKCGEARKDLENHQDLPIDKLRKKDAAKEKLGQANQALAELEQQQKDFKEGKEGAKQVKTADMEAAKEAAEQAQWEYDEAEEALYSQPEASAAEGNGEASEESQSQNDYEREINGQTYVDIDAIEEKEGFEAACEAAEKAGLLGKEIIYRMKNADKRWNQIGGKTEQQKKDLDALKSEMKCKEVIADWKKAAKSAKDPKVREAYEQAAALLEGGGKLGDAMKHLNARKDAIEKAAGAKALNKAKVGESQAKADQTVAKTANETMTAKGKEASRVAKEAREDEKLQMSKDKEEDRKRHQQFQEDMAKAKYEYQKSKDEGKKLSDTAANLNPGIVAALEAAKDNCKNDLKKGEIEQVLINLRSEASRDPSKALAWQEKADRIVNGRAKKTGDTPDITVDDLQPSNKQKYSAIDKDAQDRAIGAKLNGKPTTGGLTQQEKASNTSSIDGILNTLGLGTNVTGVIEGPTYSTYTLAKNPHIDENRIAAKIKSIQSELGRNDGVRVITQSDGSLALQVPNKNPQQVNFGEIFKSPEWNTAKKNMKLPVILGKDGEGKPMIVDLADELHMLIGGATGQGKSVLMNSIVSSLMAARDAGEIDIDMLDPKALEFTQYEDSPHLTRKPCTEPAEMAARIEDFEARMRKQQAALAAAGRKDGRKYSDIWAYNAAHPEAKMKPAVMFIDECADVLNDKRAKASLAKVLALGRASGFHVVMATQRPSREVMSSKALANVESRIAFKTADDGDSETILDKKGAEDLVGKGDMIFKPRKGQMMRGQGAYMTDQENADLIKEIGNAHSGKANA